MTTKFNIGDVVEGVMSDVKGHRGTVVCFPYGDSTRPGVDFGPDFDGHTLGEAISTTTGWWCEPEWIELITPATPESDNPLYYFQAHEDLGSDSWNVLAEKCSSVITIHGGAAWEAVLKDQFKEWEVDFKTATSQPIPGAWRSAKSVIKNAVEQGVTIKEGERVRGKTAVEKDIKAAKQRDKEEKCPEFVLMEKLHSAVKHAAKHGINFVEYIDAYKRTFLD